MAEGYGLARGSSRDRPRRFDADCGEDGPVALLALKPQTALVRAAKLIAEYPLGTVDALHLAVALAERERHDLPMVLVTRDTAQSSAAASLGLATA